MVFTVQRNGETKTLTVHKGDYNGDAHAASTSKRYTATPSRPAPDRNGKTHRFQRHRPAVHFD